MNAGTSTERQVRAQHRHELRTLTYLTLEHANGGIVRNLNQNGLSAQMVAAVRPYQQLRIRFELRHPRLQVETRGEVMWASVSGQCGIRFLDLPAEMRRKINEWILGDLLEGISLHAERTGAMFGGAAFSEAGAFDHTVEEDDGLLISGPVAKVIPLPLRTKIVDRDIDPGTEPMPQEVSALDWLSQPLSARGIAWTIDVLVFTAALLLFALVFLSVIGEAPRWPIRMAVVAAASVAVMYWGFFWVFGGKTLGVRLARGVGLTTEASKNPVAEDED
jgi:PilZ domain